MSSFALQFFTPPRHVGLGSVFVGDATLSTRSNVSFLPTNGLLVLNVNSVGDMVEMAARLPEKMNYLGNVILKFSEKCIIHELSSYVSSDESNNNKINQKYS